MKKEPWRGNCRLRPTARSTYRALVAGLPTSETPRNEHCMMNKIGHTMLNHTMHVSGLL
jgi:hypothetical protein